MGEAIDQGGCFGMKEWKWNNEISLIDDDGVLDDSNEKCHSIIKALKSEGHK